MLQVTTSLADSHRSHAGSPAAGVGRRVASRQPGRDTLCCSSTWIFLTSVFLAQRERCYRFRSIIAKTHPAAPFHPHHPNVEESRGMRAFSPL